MASSTPRGPLAGQSEAYAEYLAVLKAVADPDCRVCRGRGTTTGYIAPSKTATYACHCTGQADWQR